MKNQNHPLLSRRFLPLFVTQFLGALNDNIFKNALVIFILFTLAAADGQFYATAAAGVFILPFVLFSAVAGQLADRFDKAVVMRTVKAAEIVIMMAGAAAFYLQSPPLLLEVLFLTGAHSAFFGPAKYSILPQHLPPETLVMGNGVLSLGTFTAILLGTITGALGIAGGNGVEVITAVSLLAAVAGCIASLYIPAAPPERKNALLPLRPFSGVGKMLKLVLSGKEMRRCTIGIAWFWFLGATYLSQFPNLAKHIFNADEKVVTLFLVMFTLGTGAGSVLAGKIKTTKNLASVAALALAVFGLDFCLAAKTYIPAAGLADIQAFLSQGLLPCRLLADLFLSAAAGGLFYVPLYAKAQRLTRPEERARVMAGIGFLDAVFMVVSSLAGMAILALGFSGLDVLLTAALLTIFMVFYQKSP